MRQDKWYVNLYGSNEGRVYVGPLGATCGVAEVHTTAGREQALRDAETIVDAVNSVDELREQNRVLASKADNLGRVLAIAIMALRYYAKTAISARAVEAMEKMAKLQVFSCFYCSQDHLWLAAQDGWHATKKEGIKVRCEAAALTATSQEGQQ